MEYGAQIRVIAPEACEAVEALADADRIEWLQRCYETGDLRGARYVVCATDDRALNETVYADGTALNALVNVVDVPDLCNAIVPSIMRRGNLQIAISTGGAAPSLARQIRKAIEQEYGEYWAAYIDTVGQVRNLVKQRVPGDYAKRAPLFEALTASDLEARYAAGERLEPEAVYEVYIAPLLEGDAS